MTEDIKTYDLEVFCNNCQHSSVIKVPFGKVVQKYTETNINGFQVYNGLFIQKQENIMCPICGTNNLITKADR